MKFAGKFGTMFVLLVGATSVFAQSQQQTPPPAQPSAPLSQTDQKAAPKDSAPAAKKPSTADENPFPEEQSRKAAQADDAPTSAPPRSAAPAEPESSSRAKFQGIPDMTDDETSRISNGAGGYIVNPKLAVEDVRVGGFYLDRRDYKGAYARFKEATLVDPGNADAVFGLAEAARGLNHKDEAVTNYRVYLDAVPDSKKAKEARKALAALGEPTQPEK